MKNNPAGKRVMPDPDLPFWKRKKLTEMTPEEWESLCDGCARCCLIKLQDEDSSEIFYTNVACRLLDRHHCRCKAYDQRTRLIPACLVVTPELATRAKWLPETCAYRLLAEGKDLLWWHPLVSGTPKSVHTAGISVRGKAISERGVDQDRLEDYVVDWLG